MKLKWKMDSNGTYFCKPSLLGHDRVIFNISINKNGEYELRELNSEHDIHIKKNLEDAMSLAQRYYDLCLEVIKPFCIVSNNESED